MANNQHALVRYVTLDRCLSRYRFTKEELIARCSTAVSDLTGDHRQLSERTFFNDLQALRDGIILGRCASIICTQGRYTYEVQGRSLFSAGDAEVEAMARKLALMEGRVQEALELLQKQRAPPGVLAEMRALLLGDGLFGWVAGQQRQAMKEHRGWSAQYSVGIHRGKPKAADVAGADTPPAGPGERDGGEPIRRREVRERLGEPREGNAPSPTTGTGEGSTPPGGKLGGSASGQEASGHGQQRGAGAGGSLSGGQPRYSRSSSRMRTPLTREQAEKMAFAALGAASSRPSAIRGVVASFFLRLRTARLLRVVKRVVG